MMFPPLTVKKTFKPVFTYTSSPPPDLTFHLDADPDPDPTPGFKQVGKNRKLFGILLTAETVYIVL